MSSSQFYTKLIHSALIRKDDLTKKSIRQVRNLYSELASDLIDKAGTARGGFTKAWLYDYSEFLDMKAENLRKMLFDITSGAIKEGARISASVNGDFLAYMNGKYKLDIPPELLDYAYSVNDDVIASIINGNFYKDSRSLSKRIWKNVNGEMEDIQYILTKGIAEQRSYLDIIKDLEAYVNPEAKKPWDFRKVYPKLRSRKIDYNAQRLLRTSITQMYQLEANKKAKENPYITKAKWNLSAQHADRQVKHFGPDECDDRAGKLFDKNNIPLQHPQCLCYITYEIDKSLDEIGKEINDWVVNGENKDLDEWFNAKGGNIDKIRENIAKNNSKKGNDSILYKYKESKTTIEANTFAQNILGNKVSYSGIDVEVANEYNRGLTKFANVFPEIKDVLMKTSTVKADKDNYYACVGSNAKWGDENYSSVAFDLYLKINKKYNSSIATHDSYAKNDLKSNFHTERTSSIAGTMAHELSHALEWKALCLKHDIVPNTAIPTETWGEIVKDKNSHTISKNILDNVFKDMGISEVAQDIIIEPLGKYAYTNDGETIAEAFSDYFTSDEPLEFSKNIVNEYRKLIDKLNKK